MTHTCDTIDGVIAYIRDNSKPGDWQLCPLTFPERLCVRSAKPCAGTFGQYPVCQCPLCWVATALGLNPKGYSIMFQFVTPGMGLGIDDATRLAHAADNFGEPELYARMLEACHLSHKEPTA